ncbi:MAG: proteasome protein [Nocardioidaceae bacterium]|nr:proteasome protein [Nocardioidaceae bacterium]
MKWMSRFKPTEPEFPLGDAPVMIYALEGFLGAGSASRLAAEHLDPTDGDIVYSFDIDDYYDYRARRPVMTFNRDHYSDYEAPSLHVVRKTDTSDRPYLLLSGPEPDFRWEQFAEEVHDVVEDFGVSLSLSMGAVPMGVPHTRPLMITSHGTRPELIDRKNLWDAQVMVPSSAMSLVEYRLGQHGHDAAGYVVHVPHYLAQVDFPTASIALLDAVGERTGLRFDLDALRLRQASALGDIETQIREQDGGSLLAGLEEQYDAFTRGATDSLLASDESIPDGDELGRQFEQFLASQDNKDDRD